MNHRHTLNGLQPRTLADSSRDPYDCIDYRLRDAMERQEQRKTLQVRNRYHACLTDQCQQGGKPCPTPAQCTISLDTSWLGKVAAWFGRWA